MKNVIITLLCTGVSKTKKYKVKDLPYFLHSIFEDMEVLGIKANNNRFWNPDNLENRKQLIGDMQGYTKSMQSGTKFTIINRCENGDSYGIERELK